MDHGAVNYAMGELERGGVRAAPHHHRIPMPTGPLGDGWYELDVIDTTARLNINTEDVATIGKLAPF